MWLWGRSPVPPSLQGEKLILAKFCLGDLHPKAFVGQLQNDGMMHEPIDGGGDHGILENTIPLTEDEIAGDHKAAAFVSFCKEGEEHFHLFGALLDIAKVVENEDVAAIQFSEQVFEGEVSFGDKHFSIRVDSRNSRS